MSAWIWDDCPACEALGAELCDGCTGRVLEAIEREEHPADPTPECTPIRCTGWERHCSCEKCPACDVTSGAASGLAVAGDTSRRTA